VAPVAVLTAPVAGTELIEGQQLVLEATATDDGRVTSVSFLANGESAGLDQAAPYAVPYTVPLDTGGNLAVEAIARDTNGNLDSSGVQNFAVVPDPGSTVTGLVVDTSEAPVEGAEVTILEGFATTTGADGRFSLSGVPTVVETYTVRARITPESGRPLKGSAAPVPPVRGGTTDTGTIVVREAPLFDGQKFPLEDAPVDLAVADFDADGDADVAVAISSIVQRIRYFPNNGDGTLAASTLLESPPMAPARLVTGELTGDAHLDLLVAQGAFSDASPAQVSVYPGDGTGEFGSPVNSPLQAGNRATGVVLEDVDADGDLDIVTATGSNTTNNVEVLLGNGDGTFAAGVAYAAGLQVNSIVVGDFDEDSAPDILALDFSGHQIFLLANDADGSGNFGPAVLAIAAVSGRVFPSTGVAADFNGDGNLDLAVGFGTGSNPSGSAVVALGNGDGTFREPVAYAVSSMMSPSPVSLNARDMNGDDVPDLVLANRNVSEVAILPGTGDGTFGDPVTVASAPFPLALVPSDMDNDGDTDTVSVSLAYDVMVHRNGGDADLTPPPPATEAPGGSEPVAVAASDFDGDSIIDLAVSFRISDNVGIFRGKADGTFESPVLIPVSSTPTNVSEGDFNGDGITDLAVPSQDNNLVTLLAGNGDGTFGSPLEVDLGIGNLPGYATVGRFNNDPFDDIAVAVETAQMISVLLGNGDGTFQAPGFVATGRSPQFLTHGDLDQDEVADLVVGIDDFPGGVEVHLGNGDGTFAAGNLVFPIANGLYIQHMDVVDLDQDGFKDITVMTGYSDPVDSKGLGPFLGSFYLLYGRSGGGFDDAVFQPGNGPDPGQGSVADVDGDDIFDLVSASGDGRDVSVLLGSGGRSFLPEQRYSMNRPGRFFGTGGARFQVFDANGDGLNDIVAVFGHLSAVQTLIQLP
jgi:hypothetical protein